MRRRGGKEGEREARERGQNHDQDQDQEREDKTKTNTRGRLKQGFVVWGTCKVKRLDETKGAQHHINVTQYTLSHTEKTAFRNIASLKEVVE